eukprot:259658_1
MSTSLIQHKYQHIHKRNPKENIAVITDRNKSKCKSYSSLSSNDEEKYMNVEYVNGRTSTKFKWDEESDYELHDHYNNGYHVDPETVISPNSNTREYDENVPEDEKEQSECAQMLIRCPKATFDILTPKISMILAVGTRGSALLDLITDLNLLFRSSNSHYLALTVSLFLSIITPYFIQYSCGIKLFTQRR